MFYKKHNKDDTKRKILVGPFDFKDCLCFLRLFVERDGEKEKEFT